MSPYIDNSKYFLRIGFDENHSKLFDLMINNKDNDWSSDCDLISIAFLVAEDFTSSISNNSKLNLDMGIVRDIKTGYINSINHKEALVAFTNILGLNEEAAKSLIHCIEIGVEATNKQCRLDEIVTGWVVNRMMSTGNIYVINQKVIKVKEYDLKMINRIFKSNPKPISFETELISVDTIKKLKELNFLVTASSYTPSWGPKIDNFCGRFRVYLHKQS